MTGRPGRVVVPSLGAGVALALSVPPFGWWPLAFLGAGLAYWRLAGLRLRGRLLAGWLVGLGCYVPGLFWARTFNWYGALALMAVEALTMGVAAALVPPRRGRLPAFVASFTLLEALRLRWPFGGLPLGGVFLGQAGGPLLGTARLGGPLLLTALVWAGGGAGAELVAIGSRWARRWPGWRTALACRAVAVALTPVVVLVVLGTLADLAPDGGPARRTLKVAAVQGGGRRGVDRAQVDPATVFAAQLAATEPIERSRGPVPGLVLWPEDVVSLPRPLPGTPQAATMAALARRLGTTVVAGVTAVVSTTRFENEVVAWGPDGRVVDTFEKVHRVPFGEYVPFRGLVSHLADLSGVPLDEIPGRGTGLLRTPAAPLGVMVSYEVFYADRGRASVRAGAQLLVVPTNTSSYTTSQVPAQEIAADRVQAVEEGRDLVQAAPTGYSTVVDHRGVVRRRSVLGARQLVTATVGLRTGGTLYERFGDLPVLALATLGLLAGWWRAHTPRAGTGPTYS